MGERLIPKLDRLGAEAGIKQMTPEMYKFAMLVRADVVAQWPDRPWVGLTEEDLKLLCAKWRIVYGGWTEDFARDIEAELKEKNT